jgi:hypothetical protein
VLRIQGEALRLGNTPARETTQAVSDPLWHVEYGLFEPEYTPATAAWLCANEGREVLGALLRREPVAGVPPSLARLAQACITRTSSPDPLSDARVRPWC